MRKYYFILFFIAYAGATHSAEISKPSFEHKPMQYAQKTWVKGANKQKVWVTNALSIGDFTDTTLKFYLQMTGEGELPCNASGVATKLTDNSYLFAQDTCRLGITFGKNRITLSDKEQTCNVLLCNKNVTLDHAEFFKANH